MVDLTKNLKELEGITGKNALPSVEDWPSALVSTCERLYEKPLKDFTVEDLRIMIGQHFGLEFLVEMALERLATNPFEQGDCYPGDLLTAVLSLPVNYWREHADLYWDLAAIVQGAVSVIDTMLPDVKRFQAQPPPNQAG